MYKAELLARRWMPGQRQRRPGQKPRAAWEHPQDLVLLLGEVVRDDPEYQEMIRAAWLHDIIEDGQISENLGVTADDLRNEGIPESTVQDVISLTHNPGEEKEDYFARVASAPQRVQIVKVVDRICNLREGKGVFKQARWVRYVDETFTHVRPLTSHGPPKVMLALSGLLAAAIAERAIYTPLDEDLLRAAAEVEVQDILAVYEHNPWLIKDSWPEIFNNAGETSPAIAFEAVLSHLRLHRYPNGYCMLCGGEALKCAPRHAQHRSCD